jgi:hypothetical protein
LISTKKAAKRERVVDHNNNNKEMSFQSKAISAPHYKKRERERE